MEEQRPDLFIVSSNRAVDLGIVHLRSLNSYFDEKMKLYGSYPYDNNMNQRSHTPEVNEVSAGPWCRHTQVHDYANFVIEYQHHKATLDYMSRINCAIKSG